MSKGVRALLHWAGAGLAVLGVVFVTFRLHTYAGNFDLSALGWELCLLIVLLAMVYGAANVLLALAWRSLLAYLQIAVGRGWAIRAYGVSQLAKYVPGNIFQFAGRQAIGMAAGLPAAGLLKSTFLELLSIAVVGASAALLVLPLLWPGVPPVLGPALWVFGGAVALLVVKRLVGANVVRALLLQGLFLAISATLFVILFQRLGGTLPGGSAAVPLLAGGYVIAWLAGLVTPGAPAGVGVRELVLLLLFKGTLVEADLLMAVAMGRAVTVLGDLAYFVLCVCQRSEWGVLQK